MKIKKITNKKHSNPIPIYCLDVPPEHEIVVCMTDRQVLSKNCINFGLLFGAQSSTLMNEAIKPNWNEVDANKYISANKLSKTVREHYKKIASGEYKFIRKQNPQEDMLNAKYFAIANDVREKFFTSYVGLANWIESTRELAKKKGYVTSIYGAIRRLPYLTIYGEKYDVNKSLYSNYLNIALNSPIQNMEAIIMNRGLLSIYKEIVERKLEDKIFGQIHDAQEYYISYNDNIGWVEFIKMVHEKNEDVYPEYEGIPLEVESNIADFWGKGELWDMGKKLNTKDILKMLASIKKD